MSVKRRDLQGIRGLAVLLVLAFHLKPNLYRLGFIGVDMFFVLSGYLMSIILGKEAMTIPVVKQFYLRRFKRIVPLFYTIVLLVFLGCYHLLVNPDDEQLVTDLKWSIPFVSNIQPLFQKDGYWDQIVSYRFLVHAWSLGVEIQFYCIAPLIFGVGQCMGAKSEWLYIVLLISSLLSQVYSPPKVAYGLLHCRVWQFLSSVVLTWFRKDKEVYEPVSEQAKISDSSSIAFSGVLCDLCVIFIVATVAINPLWITQTQMRIAGTFLTAVLIHISTPKEGYLLNNSVLNYFGDISYTLYLVHWPILVALKYYLNVEQLNNDILLFTLVLVVMTSVQIHHTIEVNYSQLFAEKVRKLEDPDIFILSCVSSNIRCFFALTSDIPPGCKRQQNSEAERKAQDGMMVPGSSSIRTQKFLVSADTATAVTMSLCCVGTILLWSSFHCSVSSASTSVNLSPAEYAAAIKWNIAQYKMNAEIYKLPCARDNVTHKWTNWTGEPLMRCQTYSTGKLRILILGNSVGFRAFPLIHNVLDGRYKELRLFTSSDTKAMVYRPFNESVPDSALTQIQECFDYFSTRSRVMVIDMPYYQELNMKVGYELAIRLQKGISLADMKINRETDDKQQYYLRLRLKRVKCRNCLYNPINEALYEGNYFYLYNRTSLRAYSGEGWHLTPEGLQLVRPSYEKVINKVLSKL